MIICHHIKNDSLICPLMYGQMQNTGKDNKMKLKNSALLALIIMTLVVSPARAKFLAPYFVEANALNIRSSPKAPVDPNIKVDVVPLSPAEQSSLLAKRFSGGLGATFERFANMFVVSGMIATGSTIGLATESSEIENTVLNPAFPNYYEPTLRELLDMVARQTGSKWAYDPTGRFIHTDKKQDKPLTGIAIFEFKKCAPETPPYAVKLPDNWKAIQGNGVTHFISPLNKPGLDIYEVGTYSGATTEEETKLLQSLPTEIGLMWANMIKPSAAKKDLQVTKLGKYDAVKFETPTTGKDKQQVIWRNWGITVGKRGFALLSVIPESDENKVSADIEAILKTLEIRD